MISTEDLLELELSPLPAEICALCLQLEAPARLVAHLTLVHDVALKILRGVRRSWPTLRVDEASVAFGAATHDIGKAVHRVELSSPGAEHEHEGVALLLAAGFSAEYSRFARTHGEWAQVETLALEDLLVVLADTAWKGKRSEVLDDRIVRLIGQEIQRPAWEVFEKLDKLVSKIAADSDERLQWQFKFSI